MLFNVNGQMATSYFDKELGVIKEGAGADLVIINYSGPTPVNSGNYYFHLLMGVSGAKVETTIAQGKVLMENQEVKVLDAERIKAKCRKQAEDFWKRF
jgi:cytosine/adenosine deaminase-related metal-dependent hydrolase